MLRNCLAIAIFILLGVLIYANTIESPFYFDDEPNIIKNRHIRLTKLTLENLVNAGFKSPCARRPVVNISFALNYYVHQYDVKGYHIVNLFIHILNATLLYLLFLKTLSSFSRKGCCSTYNNCTIEEIRILAFFATLLWMVHPVQTQSVTYIVQRMNSMAALFYLLSLLLYYHGRSSMMRYRTHPTSKAKQTRFSPMVIVSFIGAFFSGMLAIGSKEIAATLPVFIGLFEWYFFSATGKWHFKRKAFIGIFIFVAMVMVIFIYLGKTPWQGILAGYNQRDFSLGQRLLTQSRVIVFYITLLTFPYPSRLNLTHDFPLSDSLIAPLTTLPSILAIVGLIAIGVYGRRKSMLISFAVFWFLGHLVIESSFIPLEIIFEHRLYLPSMLFGLIIVLYVRRMIPSVRIRYTCLTIMVSVLALWTYQRNAVWQDDIHLWQDCVKKAPRTPRGYTNLGNAYLNHKHFNKAIAAYEKALEIDPQDSMTHSNLGNAWLTGGDVRKAIRHYRAALKIAPENAAAHSNLGVAFNTLGDYDKAIHHFNQAVTLDPNRMEIYNNIGNILARQNKLEGAIRYYRKAIEIKPLYAKAHYNLGNALVRKRSFHEAIAHYRKALQISPDYSEAKRNLEYVLERFRYSEEK